MAFAIDEQLLADCRTALSGRHLYWVVGGAGSGKTTTCRALTAMSGVAVYDMDAHIYGAFHRRFTAARHPVNTQWATAADGLQWLLDMSWQGFDGFNRAALPEYLDLLADDLAADEPGDGLVVDGGVCNPGVLARAIPAHRIVCLCGPPQSSDELWSQDGERASMKDAVLRLPTPQTAWRTFLEFDERITSTILEECRENGIAVCVREASDPVDEIARRVAALLEIGTRSPLTEQTRPADGAR